MRTRRTFLIISQVYLPDPAAIGQHLADVGKELVRRGHRVIVYTADHGYDDPSVAYPRRETIDGVEVRRVRLSSFGKGSIPIRLLGGALFVTQVILRAAFIRGVDAILASTSPPIGPWGAVVLGLVHRAPVKYWVMDVNPDQMVALGMLGPRSLPARAFDYLNRVVLRRAQDVIVLDRFMAERINSKVDVSEKLVILPPWPAEDPADVVSHDENPFRKEHGLAGKLVVMYSGNHGPSNPLTTIIEAGKRLCNESRLVLLFVGGGVGKREVEDARCPNIRSLPYQPREMLGHSLAAADVHVVTVGDDVRGIVHPSKIYGAMAVARPILLVGPAENHVADILDRNDIGWHVRHGDVDGAERLLLEILLMAPAELQRKGRRAREVMALSGGKAGACERVCDVIERGV
jgi:colanic acid biosynthesis glycosyl transferase WcaI